MGSFSFLFLSFPVVVGIGVAVGSFSGRNTKKQTSKKEDKERGERHRIHEGHSE